MRVVAALVILVASGFGGCLANDGADPEGTSETSERLSVDAWKGLLSEPIYDGWVESVHSVTAEDGTHLSLSLYLPEGLDPDAKIPALMELTPYQTLDRGIGIVSFPAGEVGPGSAWSALVERGVAFVRADARGTHGSAGCLDFGGSLDRSDARAFTDWIREQPWSDGRVVTDGVSHPGMGSVVAHVADVRLTGAIATAPVVSYYMDEYYQGAHYDNQYNGAAYQAIELLPTTTTRPEDAAAQAAPCTGQTATDYDLVDGTWGPLWQDRDLALTMEANLAQGADHWTPILINHGFDDLNVQPDHAQIYWDALPGEYPKWMILGWWYHSWPDMDGHPAEEYSDIRLRFFDHHLLGMENGWDAEPRVLVEDNRGTWHESHDWPVDGSNATMWFLAADGGLGANASTGEVSFMDPVPQEQDAPAGNLLFRSEPVSGDVLVTGAPRVDLVASSDQEETKWVVFLLDEAPDGSLERISHGMSDSHRSHARDKGWGPLTPGEPTNWRLDLLPTAYVLSEGHRLVVEVSSQESDEVRLASGQGARCWDDHRGGRYCPIGIHPSATAGRATNTIHVGPEGSRVTLHVVDPGSTVKAA